MPSIAAGETGPDNGRKTNASYWTGKAMTDKSAGWRRNALTRRDALKAMGLGVTGILINACGGTASRGASPTRGDAPADFSARFAAFQPAPEPNADPTKVVWPEFVTRAGPEVRRLYEFQLQNGDLMRYMPCFCGCGADGHRNNRDCYVQEVNPNGSVVLDSMAPT